MLPAIQIADEAARVSDQAAIAKALGGCLYRLPGVIAGVWQHEQWQVLEQAYDLPDVYISYIEVHIRAPETLIPIRCPKYDLYWLYMLFGAVGITTPDGRKTLVKTAENHYRVAYLPMGRYACRFQTGTHRLFYAVHKPAALFREESPEFDVQREVIGAVQAQLATHTASEPLSMRDGAAESIRRFLHSPGQTFLKRKQATQNLSLDLIFYAVDSLGLRQDTHVVSADWAQQMKDHIDESISLGAWVDMHTVAENSGVSARYVRFIFDSVVKRPVGQYIIERKLAYAKTLLDAGSTPTAAANYLGWSYSHFSAKFKITFGVSPSRYRHNSRLNR